MSYAEAQLNDFCQNAGYNLENCITENKKLTFNALDIKVYASKDCMEIQGTRPLELPTAGQTSGCMLIHHEDSVFRLDCL